ncbi:hypothetical protein Salat_2529700 [Sesamum alatum]|uniref:Secreted protein n=1 Tax=Sesamum alatum TaxID=300844 RepID=A0AAE1XSZ0_9LAMI|nr:hypothetical protein Salat_2529700 [Sesamum alatum]
MAPSPTTRVLIPLLVEFCGFPMILSSRILMHECSHGRRFIVQKGTWWTGSYPSWGATTLTQECRHGRRFIVERGTWWTESSPSRGTPLRRNVAMGGGSSFREVLGGPDPHHHEGPPPLCRNVAMGGGSSFREVPGRPNPRHHGGPPPRVPLV